MYKEEENFLKTIGEINDKEKPLLFTKLEVLILLKDYKEQLLMPRVVNCKHEDYTPCYGREGELMFKQCDTCGEEFD